MVEMRYIWEWPVRLTHWVNVLCIVVLSAHRLLHRASLHHRPGNRRLRHGLGPLHSFRLRLSLHRIGRFPADLGHHRQSALRLEGLLPLGVPRWAAQHVEDVQVTTPSPRKKIPAEIWGHNSLAALAYSGVMILFLTQIVTGFALYGQFAPGGFWNTIFGPLLVWVGAQMAAPDPPHDHVAAHRLHHPSRLQRLADGREGAQRHHGQHLRRLQVHQTAGISDERSGAGPRQRPDGGRRLRRAGGGRAARPLPLPSRGCRCSTAAPWGSICFPAWRGWTTC